MIYQYNIKASVLLCSGGTQHIILQYVNFTVDCKKGHIILGSCKNLLSTLNTCKHISFFLRETRWPSGLCAGLRIKRSGFETWPGHCVVFLGKTLCSHSASLHPGV